MSYNGHANYETWVISMYIGGNYTGEGTCRFYESLVNDRVEIGYEEPREDADSIAYHVAEELKDAVEMEIFGEDDSLSTGIVGDLLGAAMSEIDWHDIAESRVSDALSALS